MTDFIDAIMAFESGELDDAGIIELFQHLVDSGVAWQLQGSYGRTATALVEAGLVTWPEPEGAGEHDPAGHGMGGTS
jgi:hypothetical protein